MAISNRKLLRWSGLANLLAGLLTAVFWFLHPGLGDPANALEFRWSFSYVLFILLLIFFLWGLTGLYARQSERVGILGLAGYLLGFVGTAFFIGAGAYDAFVTPVLRADAAELIGPEGFLVSGGIGNYLKLTGMCFGLGYVLFGIAAFRAKVFPAWMGLVLAASAPILGLSPLMPHPVRLAGCLVFGLVNMALGWRNWSWGDS